RVPVSRQPRPVRSRDQVAGVPGDDSGAKDFVSAFLHVDSHKPLLVTVEDGAVDILERAEEGCQGADGAAVQSVRSNGHQLGAGWEAPGGRRRLVKARRATLAR